MSQKDNPKRVLPKLKLRFKEASVNGTRPPWRNFPAPIYVAYTKDEIPCPFLLLLGNTQLEVISKRVTNLNLMKLDVMKSRAAINFVTSMTSVKQDDVNTDFVMKTFIDASIIWYSKLFIDSDNGKIKLDHKKIYGDNKHIKLHKKIVEIRHGAIAHQTGRFDLALAFVALNPDAEQKEIIEFYYNYISYGSMELEELKTFEDMLNILIESIDQKIYGAEDRLLKDLTDKIGIEKLYELSFKVGDESDISGSISIETNYAFDNYETYNRFHGEEDLLPGRQS
ncbi:MULTISPECIES: hypothetical protein [Acidithiobacillus]|jgi:hypothetical protein|uniref:Uncharacterized protein n=1 Tax=Acidithiobacillus ferrooxidans TaxID=920 RepID=A0A2W1K3T3_ACIFR|nr:MULTISPECIES: hypothetical protein [Acidithiobacillus]ACH84962.1 hypothetical protein Lferr_2771 [Acidithiobacillus ferrooxidans ATCC 53993]MBN6745728.1 hypothetical protein [Acidithiobacillus sp. MC2.2]MBN6748639.1 hypothetical protein [Acidithiobacillus sp. PG05]MCR0968104.1 hypothetical protein [Acidithiobacillus ferrooxidans]MCR1343086.1 hypothetical protein [Acidithiobacillus ferrooxidans]